jgi:hypothetical protein
VTGKLSTHSGSLRAGLLVPVFALATMMTLNGLRAFRKRPSDAPVR